MQQDYSVNGRPQGVPPPPPPPGVDRLGFTPLYNAAFKGDVAKITELLASGADLEGRCTSGETALHGAVYSNKPKAIQALLEAGADMEVTGFHSGHTPLHRSATTRSTKPLEMLLAAGANINAIDTYGHTALYVNAPTPLSSWHRHTMQRGTHYPDASCTYLLQILFQPTVRIA